MESPFTKNSEKWTAVDEFGREVELKYDGFSQTVGVRAIGNTPVYFVAPRRFLEDQRNSYNQLLEFTLRINDNRPTPSAADIVLEGGGTSISTTIFAQQNRLPSVQVC